MQKHLSKIPFFLFALFLLSWITLNRDWLFDASQFLPRDNRDTFFFFWYIAQYCRAFSEFPRWFFTTEAGIWIEVMSNSLHLMLPHRLLGYFLVTFTDLHPNLIFKWTFLFFGQGLFLWGNYALAKTVLRSTRLALALVATMLVTSLGISFIHQEQAFSTLFYVPFVWLALLATRKDLRFVPLFFSVLGLSLNFHYPQLLFLYWVVSLASLLLVPGTWTDAHRIFRELRQKGKRKYISLALCGFTLSALPAFYSYFKYKDVLASPIRRQSETIIAQDYNDYLKMAILSAGINPPNFQLYLGLEQPKVEWMEQLDSRALYLAPAFLVLVLMTLTVQMHLRFFFVATLIAYGLLSTGIYGPIPQLFWDMVPGGKMFRQYYHFISFFNLHLLFFLFVAVKEWKPLVLDATWKRATWATVATICLGLTLSGTLKPIVGFGTAFFTLIKILPPRHASLRRLMPLLLVAWIILGSLPWTFAALRDFRTAIAQTNKTVQAQIQIPLDNQNADAFAQSLLFEGSYFYRDLLPLVTVRGLSWESIRKMSQQSTLFWSNGKTLFPATRATVTVRAERGGFSISNARPPASAISLLLLQYNDGRWRMKKDGVFSNFSQSTVFVDIPSTSLTSGELVIARAPSVWNYLIWWMWLPTMTSLFYLLISRSPARMPTYTKDLLTAHSAS